MYLKEIDLGWTGLAWLTMDNWRTFVNRVMNIRVSENAGNFLTRFTRLRSYMELDILFVRVGA
jgi:hypothetical protein